MNIQQLLRKLTRATLAAAAGLTLPGSLFAAGTPEALLDTASPRVQAVMGVQKQYTKDLMTLPEILGTAVGQDDDGEMAMIIFVNSEAKNHGEVMRSLPNSLKGARIKGHLTDAFRALAGKPGGGGGVSHTAKQPKPIQLGTSGGWRFDLANGYCCGGTLGSLIQVNNVKYILSNYHVFEADIVSGGNTRVATDGDFVIQPGLIDVGCNAVNVQNVGTLVKLSSLSPSSLNNVDCSVAQVIPGQVSEAGAILEIGTLSSQTVGASISQKVKKSGRTTGLTRSTISGLNATISVAYDNECAGGSAFTKTFTGQIVIANRRSAFLAGGDSGSLMVQDVTTNPKAVGLLYAGSSTSAIANPISDVLTFVGGALGGTATMVGVGN